MLASHSFSLSDPQLGIQLISSTVLIISSSVLLVHPSLLLLASRSRRLAVEERLRQIRPADEARRRHDERQQPQRRHAHDEREDRQICFGGDRDQPPRREGTNTSTSTDADAP